MPLGIQRLNAKKTQPNDHIVFIKPLKGRNEALSLDYLERIAAQCLPIMKEHHLSVTSLEEYKWNPEFVGRNFNHGEMVMMHELAHNVHMNHSRLFWEVRNRYAERMRGLWSSGYSGEGLWGRGALLSTGEFESNMMQAGECLPEHLCGGTYRSRGRKRKAKQTLSYQEQKEGRILKKFGANGKALGENTEVKRKLEKGRTIAAKPRVAQSNRGRELRAAAALARLDQQKKEETVRPESDEDSNEAASGSEMESEEEYEGGDQAAAVDLDGSKLVDSMGRGLVKVCEDEASDDQDVQQEIRDLLSSMKLPESCVPGIGTALGKKEPDEKSGSILVSGQQAAAAAAAARPSGVKTAHGQVTITIDPSAAQKPSQPREPLESGREICAACSFANGKASVTCSMCANVLKPELDVDPWACQSQACQGAVYRNPGDYGICAICNQRRSVVG